MKIALASDLHLEFGHIELHNEQQANVLILSGDILVAQDLHDHGVEKINIAARLESLSTKQNTVRLFREFLKNCSSEFDHVIYVAGNHEFYHGSWPQGLEYLKEEVKSYPNINFLEMQSVVIDDVLFIGATLWTDMNNLDDLTVWEVSRSMNDYRIIRNSEHAFRRLLPQDTVIQHKKTLDFFKETIQTNKDKKIVVVGHHAPSKVSTKPRYVDDYHLNGAYSSDLSNFILDHPEIKLWTHGHTHDNFDYQIGSTRVVCNPRGYINHEDIADRFELKYFEI